MSKFRGFSRRVAKDQSGYSAVQAALWIALISAVAGFGLLSLGDAISNNFKAAAEKFTVTSQ